MTEQQPPSPSAARDSAIAEAFAALERRLAEGASFDELADGYAALCRQAAALSSDRPELALHIERQALAALLLAAKMTAQPIARGEALLDQLTALGWPSLYDKTMDLLVFGRYCMEQRTPARALPRLAALDEELRVETRTTGAPWARRSRRQLRRLVAQLGRIAVRSS